MTSNNASSIAPLMLLVTIVDRGKGERIAQICSDEKLYFNFLCFGEGTATSEILDLLGLGTTDKDVVLSIMSKHRVRPLIENISEQLRLKKPGRGIAFSVPVTGLNRFVCHALQRLDEEFTDLEEGGEIMDSTTKHRLILTVLNAGYTDEAMEAAKAAGATGGTILHARGLSTETAENFLGIPLQAEKEVLVILAKKDQAPAIMEAINSSSGLKTEAKAIVMCLPVSNMAGLG